MLLTALCVFGGSGAVFAQPRIEIEEAWSKSNGFPLAPAPLALDINLDGRLEIIQVAVNNEVSAMDPLTGKILWQKNLGLEESGEKKYALMSPVAGHFLGQNRINIFVPTLGGKRCFVLDGATGDVSSLEAPFTISLAPTVFPWTDGEDQEAPFRQGLILYDSTQSRIHGYRLESGRLEEVFRFSTQDPLVAPPVVGQTGLAEPQPHIAWVTTTGKVTVMSARNPAGAVHHLLDIQVATELPLTLCDVDGDRSSELIACDKNGYLYALRVNQREFQSMWNDAAASQQAGRVSRVQVLKQPVFAPVAIDANGDGAEDVLIPRERGYGMLSGKSGRPLWPEEYPHDSMVKSPPAIFYGDGKPMAFFCDEVNANLLSLADRTHAGRLRLGRGASTTPLVLPLFPENTTGAVVRTDTDGKCFALNLKMKWDAEYPPWMGWRGSPTRKGRLDRDEQFYLSSQLAMLGKRLEENLARARNEAAAGDYRKALGTLQNDVLAANPYHVEGLKLRSSYFLRANIVMISITSLVTLAVLGIFSWIGFRRGRAATQFALAKRAEEKGPPERAIYYYQRLARDFPKNRNYSARLASMYIAQKQFNKESAPAFERAYRFFPQEETYLKALATAYSSEPRFDEQAAAVYNVMAKISRKPGPWYFLLGQSLQKIGRPREALDAYRLAIVHQFEDPRLAQAMADLYIELGITSPEILPTLDRVLPERQNDSAFLRTYCRACQEARRYDDQSQAVAQRLLELDPEAPAGHSILATRLIQSGRHKDAMNHAQQILQVNPNDSIGLRMLGACYAAERRLDETAMKIFAKALEANPDAPEILIAVSHGFIQENRHDPEARDIFRKALVHYPQDETVLMHLASIAERDQDDELTIRTIEPLLSMGRQNRELILQLANAYCRLGIVEDKALDIYREALVYQPDHATIQENLAAILLRKERTDMEAMKLFESVLERTPDRFDIGLQLMRCYNAAEMPEKGLALGEKLSQLQPENPELQKMMAAASAKADQMESAITGYEHVLAGKPDDADAICALAGLYGRKRRSDNMAIEIYLKAIQLQPTNVDAYLAAARAYAVRDSMDHSIQSIKNLLTRCPTKINEAIGLMENLVESRPKEFKLRWYLVDTLIFDGRLREARKHIVEMQKLDAGQSDISLKALEKILEKNPKDALAHLERGRILAAQGRERDARQALEQAHRFHPENEEIARALMSFYQKVLERQDSAEVRFQLGRMAMRLDKHDLAISCFQTTARDYRWEGESVRNLARCFMAKGMLDLSMQELKRLPMEDDVKELLYELGQRYEAVGDIQGAREVYKLIFAADITFKDVKGKLENLNEQHHDVMAAERTAIMQSLSEEAGKRYELMEELGRGAMGIVYKARDTELEETVALKILPDSLIRNQEAVRRFRQEARSARRLAHPNVVRIHDIGEEQGRKYISMEFVEGSDLKQKLRAVRRKLPFEDALRYSQQVAEAMAYAHSIGIVHRDIKPANLMLTKDDMIKVTDFGIAKIVEQTQAPEATQVGAVIGTPLYMSPEQVKGEQVDHRADIYSMGIVMYELAGGYPPFTEGDLSYQHLFVEPKPLPAHIPAEYSAIVMKALAKKPDDRWQSVAEMQEALRKVKA